MYTAYNIIAALHIHTDTHMHTFLQHILNNEYLKFDDSMYGNVCHRNHVSLYSIRDQSQTHTKKNEIIRRNIYNWNFFGMN